MRNSPIHLGTLALKSSINQIIRLNAAKSVSRTNIEDMKNKIIDIDNAIEQDPLNTILKHGERSMLTYRIENEKEQIQKIEHEVHFYAQELQRKIASYKPMLCLLYPDFELESLFDDLEEFAHNEQALNGETLIERLDFVKQLASNENDNTLSGRYNKAMTEGVLNNV